MSTEDLKLFNELLREKVERVTNERNELKMKLDRMETFKKTGNNAA